MKKYFLNKIKDESEVKSILEDVKQNDTTVYSAIYDLENGAIKLWVEQNYKYEHVFNIKEVTNGKEIIDFGELKFRAMLSQNM